MFNYNWTVLQLLLELCFIDYFFSKNSLFYFFKKINKNKLFYKEKKMENLTKRITRAISFN